MANTPVAFIMTDVHIILTKSPRYIKHFRNEWLLMTTE